jgi:hypothetical protein
VRIRAPTYARNIRDFIATSDLLPAPTTSLVGTQPGGIAGFSRAAQWFLASGFCPLAS